MVHTSIVKRMRKLRALLDIRIGPGAAVLSPTVKRIHLNFARSLNDGHMGPRKFWHEYMPRLKYHNPAIPMTIERTEDNEGPASLTLFFADAGAQGLPAPTGSTSGDKELSDHSPLERVRMIDMKHKNEREILKEVLRLCEGKPIIATADEEEQLRDLESEKERAETDRVRQKKVVREQKRRAEVLQAAKQSMDTV